MPFLPWFPPPKTLSQKGALKQLHPERHLFSHHWLGTFKLGVWTLEVTCIVGLNVQCFMRLSSQVQCCISALANCAFFSSLGGIDSDLCFETMFNTSELGDFPVEFYPPVGADPGFWSGAHSENKMFDLWQAKTQVYSHEPFFLHMVVWRFLVVLVWLGIFWVFSAATMHFRKN